MRPCRLALTSALLLVVALPGAAHAGTATVGSFVAGRSSDTFLFVHYVAAPGERNDVTASLLHTGDAYVGVIHDTAGATPGKGCVAADPDTVRCALSTPATDDTDGGGPSPTPFLIRLGDGNDRARIVPAAGVAADIDGGPGNDRLVGGTGGGIIDDDTPGLDGNVLRGGPGNDVLVGGAHDDLFDERGTGPNGSDTIRGGPGVDAVDYAGRRGPVHADLRGDRRAGEKGEHDHLAGDLERVRGGSAGDILIANDRGDVLIGGPGPDRLHGGTGADLLAAGAGPLTVDEESIPGVSRRDHSRNVLSGGGGNDELFGAAGPDVLDGGPGRDSIAAGAGDDHVLAHDGSHDEIDCGAGDDRARLDGVDFSTGCERRRLFGAPEVTPVAGDNAPGAFESLSGGGNYTAFTYGCPDGFPARRCVFAMSVRIGSHLAVAKRFSIRRGRATEGDTGPMRRAARRIVDAHETTRGTLTIVTHEPGGRSIRRTYTVRIDR